MKKYIAVFAALLLLSALLPAPEAAAERKLSIVTTIFPEYDWVMEILGENAPNVQVTMLLDNGVDLHSYQPNVKDMVTLSTCDLFLYVGGESDSWVDDALAGATNKNMIVINLLEVLGENAKEELPVEGMEHSHEEEEHHEEAHAEEDHEHEAELDEHVWLSLRNASLFCQAIRDALITLDPENEELYRANTEDYLEELSRLDDAFAAAVAEGSQDTLLFGDRFPFRYLTDDYGLQYYAAFSGCSAETEASFETVIFLANKLDELGLHTVMTLEGSDGKLAQTIISTAKTGADILCLDSMQSTTKKDVQEGAKYLAIMEKNLDVLAQALR
ncbi:MAG: metal ABC transporter substrate-binding protein [Clostridiales bacterium]|nr:metal ABC transporter substrate-binding protein [Clostridiales bacterium]